MERKLATIQTIKNLEPIPGADLVEKATVMGWSVVVSKGEFKVNDPCVFFEIDSILPDGPAWSEKFRKRDFRIKTMKLRGVLSQGLALPTSTTLPNREGGYNWGEDVTELLGVTKYEPPATTNMAADIAGHFPSGVPKTDEIRLQSCLDVLREMDGRAFYVTVKCDGRSATFIKRNGELVAASRNFTLKDPRGTAGNAYAHVIDKYRMNVRLPEEMAIQGELCGPGLQKNLLGLHEPELFVFNVFDVKNGKYLDLLNLLAFCKEHQLQTVPVLEAGSVFGKEYDLDYWLKYAEGKYPGTKNNREGIVVRPTTEAYSNTLFGRMSFKVISNSYLLKEED